MFNGIVTTLGVITAMTCEQGCKSFTLQPQQPFHDLSLGESIAVNGVCLTVTHFTHDTFTVTAVPETLRLTNLKHLAIQHVVNLERALQLGARISGHVVQGHVDGMGHILDMHHDDSEALLVKISMTPELAKYIVAKGFITIDGMSITVIACTPEWFTVTFIPHTQDITIIKHYKKNTVVNLEVDIMGKYIEKLLGAHTCIPQ